MDSTTSDTGDPLSVKILVAGAVGVGKTTLVSAVSEIEVAATEANMTVAAELHDDLSLTPAKTTTTVAMDFGRVTIQDERGVLRLFLFGTPGQPRFWFFWDDLARGALAAIVLVDTRNLAASFPAISYFEDGGVPFIVVVNRFGGVLTHELHEIREALDLPPYIPLAAGDARERAHVLEALRASIRHALNRERQTV